jgi:hypothetical protein
VTAILAPTMLESSQRTDTTEDITAAVDAMRKSCPRYDKAQQYYEAEVPELFASARLRRAMARSGMKFQLNFARTVVDSVVDRLELASITSDDESGPDDAIQAVSECNKLELQATNVMRKACTYGDAYVIVWPREDAVEPYRPEDIQVLYQDPRTVRVFYRADNPHEVEYAAKRWEEHGKVRLDLYYPDRVESYVSKKDTKGQSAKDFVPCAGDPDSDTDGADGHVTPHDFGIVPVFHFRTDADEYGEPEHKHFYSITDIIHKLAIGHMAGVDYQAFPQRYALMMEDGDTSEAARLDEGTFSFDLDEGGTTENNTGEARSQFKSDPGSVWMAQGIKAFGQFDVADSGNFIKPMEFYLRCGATISNTPLHYFDPSGDVPSGESLKTAEAPFIKKVKTRKLSFGDTWRQVFTFALKLLGYDDAKVVVRWAPSESTDDQSTWTTAKLKQDAGVPVEQTHLEAGYTTTQVEEWKQAGESNLPQTVRLLEQLGNAMSGFAGAIAAGVVDQSTVTAVMQKLIGVVTDDGADSPGPAS